MQHPGGHGHGGKGHGAKHSRHHKHVQGKGKHHPKHQPQGHHKSQPGFVHTVAAHHPHHPRGLATGSLLPVCSFEAVAQSLRLAGQRVSDDDVLGLWDLCGRREVSIAEALDAAVRFGLAGFRPREHVNLIDVHAQAAIGVCRGDGDADVAPVGRKVPADAHGFPGVHALILGVDLPGPHAVLSVPGGWWSWGSLWTPWTTAVSEAWAVSWS